MTTEVVALDEGAKIVVGCLELLGEALGEGGFAAAGGAEDENRARFGLDMMFFTFHDEVIIA